METALEREVLFNHVFPHFSEGKIESQLENVIAKDTASKPSADLRVRKMSDRRDGV